MGFIKSIRERIGFKAENQSNEVGSNTVAVNEVDDGSIFKAYVPDFLYKPPYGFPRKENLPLLKLLSKNPYIFSVIKTLCDEATSVGWKVKVKEEFNEINKDVEKKAMNDYQSKINEITKFLRNPNGNEESFEFIMRAVLTDMFELDSGIIVKVFNSNGELKQLFARDGLTFLKNPNIYGYLGDRDDFVMPMPQLFSQLELNYTKPTPAQDQLIKQYDAAYRERAAYFQYGWTAGSMPVPFGKREIVYVMHNARADSIYGRSPIEVLSTIIKSLQYGSEFNLDFYINNNMPEGVIELRGASPQHIAQFRDNWDAQFSFTDNLGVKRKKFFKFPITNVPTIFTPFTLNPKDMDVIAQQQWFTKIVWMCFGVTADEMGFVEDSNKAVSQTQSALVKRKALKPYLKTLEYYINTQIIPEFFSKNGKMPDSGDIPCEFCFEDYDIDEDLKKHTLFEQQIRMGIKTPEMIAKEIGVDIAELKKGKEEEQQKKIDEFNATSGAVQKGMNDSMNKKPESKSKEAKQTISEIDDFIDSIGKSMMDIIDKMPEEEVRNV